MTTIKTFPAPLVNKLQDKINTSKPLPLIPPRRRHAPPGCTHIHMDRLYGNHQCTTCSRVSPFGWLYSCKQDELQAPVSAPCQIASPDYSADKSTLRTELEWIGLSEWVIKAAEAGEYTPEQLEKLKQQKLRVLLVANQEAPDERGESVVWICASMLEGSA